MPKALRVLLNRLQDCIHELKVAIGDDPYLLDSPRFLVWLFELVGQRKVRDARLASFLGRMQVLIRQILGEVEDTGCSRKRIKARILATMEDIEAAYGTGNESVLAALNAIIEALNGEYLARS